MKKLIILIPLVLLLLIAGCGQGFSEGGYFANGKALANEVKSDITEISRDDLMAMMEQGKLRVLIDVREPGEYAEGYINEPDEEGEYPYAETFTVNIPRGILEFKIDSQDYWDDELWLEMPTKNEEIVLYCQAGDRSTLAAFALKQLGYKNVKSLKGGYRKWLDPNAPEEEAVKSSGGCG
ncbi:MAG: hypothetical protein K9N06_00625 [Candidatus Cloacimonetes bacterium]|nr:hypothetical protein [Candidatus Cloacimonadota bacterium]